MPAIVLALFFPWLSLLPPSVVSVPETPLVLPGVVIEGIPAGSALEKAGLQAGDMILSWERLANPPANPEPASGRIESPFDWMWLEIEQAPRGVVRLMGERDGAPLSSEVPPGQWAADVTPHFAPLAANHFPTEDASSAIEEWRSLTSLLELRAHTREAVWLHARLGKTLAARGSREEARSHYLRAVETAPDSLVRSLVLDHAAGFFFSIGERAEAEKLFRAALELRKSEPSGELGIARNMSNLATAIYHQGRASEAEPYLHAANEVYSRIAPQAPGRVTILRNLGVRAGELGDLDRSIQYLRESVALGETVSPNSVALADSLHELGTLERDSGYTREAEAHLSQALELRERLVPGSPQLANTLNSLSLFYRSQGDLDQALVLARRSAGVSENLAGAEAHTAAALNSMALIENALGQRSEAEADLARALQLASKSTHEQAKRLVPAVLANMAVIQENQGNFSAALPLYRQALDLKRQNGRTADIAPTLRSIGILHHRLGKPEEARSYLVEALSIQQKLHPNGIETADTLDILGALLAESGDLAAARDFLEKALKIVETVAPASLVAANVYSNYGVVQQRSGALPVARQYLQQAVDLYDALFLRASHSHVALGSFGARHYSTYFNAAEVYIALGEVKSALEVAEKGRGKALRMQLAERDLLTLSDIPAEVAERMRRLEISLDQISVDEHGDPSEQRALFRERERLIAEIRRSSPRLAALRYPLALSADEIRSALDPGTILLFFLGAGRNSYLFTASRDEDLRVQALPVTESELRDRVERFRALIAEARPGTALGELRMAELRRLGKELYALLVAPAADQIERADRVLIVADGPLHYLPFAALAREVPGGDGLSRHQFLAEWKPFHSVLSATVYAELRKDRRDPAAARAGHPLLLGAFGDPQFPAGLEGRVPERIADVRVRSAVRRGTLRFEPLPSTRREVEGIAALFPAGQVGIFLGAEATEERAKSIGQGARILHFAAHARLDDRFPLNSALVLTIPENFAEGRDNGLLQVWEIFERVRLDADLVALSACDTGLGEELSGEGLIGLTRAFQYAGARSVLASLWSVQDQATSELMVRFYRHLRAGLPKDQALQAAQRELIAGPVEVTDDKGKGGLKDFGAPYHWAGFQLYGDWQ